MLRDTVRLANMGALVAAATAAVAAEVAVLLKIALWASL